MGGVEVPRRSLGENKRSWVAIRVLLVFPSKALVEIHVQTAYEERN